MNNGKIVYCGDCMPWRALHHSFNGLMVVVPVTGKPNSVDIYAEGRSYPVKAGLANELFSSFFATAS